VFQLDVGAGALTEIHPMAFEFPTRQPRHLFFPTVHVHHRSLPPDAFFSHALYAQGLARPEPRPDDVGWVTGSPPRGFVDERRAQGLVAPDAPLYRRSLYGRLPNKDQWAELPG
jgi:hypothetical protein